MNASMLRGLTIASATAACAAMVLACSSAPVEEVDESEGALAIPRAVGGDDAGTFESVDTVVFPDDTALAGSMRRPAVRILISDKSNVCQRSSDGIQLERDEHAISVWIVKEQFRVGTVQLDGRNAGISLFEASSVCQDRPALPGTGTLRIDAVSPSLRGVVEVTFAGKQAIRSEVSGTSCPTGKLAGVADCSSLKGTDSQAR